MDLYFDNEKFEAFRSCGFDNAFRVWKLLNICGKESSKDVNNCRGKDVR